MSPGFVLVRVNSWIAFNHASKSIHEITRNNTKRTFCAKPTLGILLLLTCSFPLSAQTEINLAPGAPGKDARWTSAGKQAVGTSNTLESKVWFTLQGGTLTEVFFPTADMPNVQTLEFVVVNPASRTVETERENSTHQVQLLNPHSLSFRQINTATHGAWRVIKTYTTDPARNTVLIDVKFETRGKVLALYVYFDPSLNNSGMHDTGWTQGDALLANDADKFSALVVSGGLAEVTNGFHQISDGLNQLKQNGRVVTTYARAEKGNVAQLARIKAPVQFTLALGFGKSAGEALNAAQTSLRKGFQVCRKQYEADWRRTVRRFPKVEPKYQAQFNLAALVLKAHEDKTFPRRQRRFPFCSLDYRNSRQWTLRRRLPSGLGARSLSGCQRVPGFKRQTRC